MCQNTDDGQCEEPVRWKIVSPTAPPGRATYSCDGHFHQYLVIGDSHYDLDVTATRAPDLLAAPEPTESP